MIASALALAVGLSMDSFAAALGRGAAQRAPGLTEATRVAAAFAVCQTLMPVLGWAAGLAFATALRAVDHWIAFGLLLAVGAAMVRASRAGCDEADAEAAVGRGFLGLVATGLATSVDAAAVGVGLAMVDTDIVTTAVLVGLVTFASAFGGVLLGRAAGCALGRRAELVGGLLLIGLGTKILIEHLFFGA